MYGGIVQLTQFPKEQEQRLSRWVANRGTLSLAHCYRCFMFILSGLLRIPMVLPVVLPREQEQR